MSTPFLQAFALNLIHRLVEADEIAIREGRAEAVITFLAADLAQPKEGRSLISASAAALIRCPDVDELFADDEALKNHVVAMGSVDG